MKSWTHIIFSKYFFENGIRFSKYEFNAYNVEDKNLSLLITNYIAVIDNFL